MNPDKPKDRIEPRWISAAPNATAPVNVFNPPRSKVPQTMDVWLERQKQIRLLESYRLNGGRTPIANKKQGVSDEFSILTVYGAMIFFGTIYMLVKYGTLIPPPM